MSAHKPFLYDGFYHDDRGRETKTPAVLLIYSVILKSVPTINQAPNLQTGAGGQPDQATHRFIGHSVHTLTQCAERTPAVPWRLSAPQILSFPSSTFVLIFLKYEVSRTPCQRHLVSSNDIP